MQQREIYLAGGCFWGVQKYLDAIPGVLSTEVGYANGDRATISYPEVKTGLTGHAETVRVRFDAEVISLTTLLSLFFDAIDPLSHDRQGGDIGHQYRTGVYYADETLLPEIRSAEAALTAALGQTSAVEFLPLSQYCAAEDYHQDYLAKNPDGYCHIGPDTMARLKERIASL